MQTKENKSAKQLATRVSFSFKFLNILFIAQILRSFILNNTTGVLSKLSILVIVIYKHSTIQIDYGQYIFIFTPRQGKSL